MSSAAAKQLVEERHAGPVRRPCLDCTACCDHFEIKEIEKAAGQPCPLAIAGGCGAYGAPTRPRTCAGYVCAWAMGYGRPKDRPDRSGVIVDLRTGKAGRALYGHMTREPGPAAQKAMERISADAGLDVYLERK